MHNIKFAVFYYYFYLRSFPADPSRSRVVVGCVAPILPAQLTYRLLFPTDRHLGTAWVQCVYHYGSAGLGLGGNRVINDPDKGLGLGGGFALVQKSIIARNL